MAVLYLSSASLGVLRDILILRVLGGGATTDLYFNLLVVSLAFYGFIGQATYLPLALVNARSARAFAWIGCGVSTVASVAVAYFSVGTLFSPIVVAVLAAHIALTVLAPRWAAAAVQRRIWRFGLVQLVATVLVLASIPLLPSPILLASAYVISLPVAVLLTLPRARGSSELNAHAASGPDTVSFPAASAAYQAWPGLERWASNVAGEAGEVSALAFAAKLVNVPVSLLNFALGMSRFERLLHKNGETANTSDEAKGIHHPRWPRGVAVSVGVIASSALLGAGAAIVLQMLLGPAQLPSLTACCIAYFAAAPCMTLASIRMQEILAVGQLRRYVIAICTFYVVYAVGATISIIAKEVWILPIFLAVASIGQTLMAGRIKNVGR